MILIDYLSGKQILHQFFRKSLENEIAEEKLQDLALVAKLRQSEKDVAKQ